MKCPSCGAATLREFQHRLVCDDCNGMLIAADELAASIHELDHGAEPIALAEERPSSKLCPRCAAPMMRVTVSIGAVELSHVLHCATDGLWCPQAAMTAAFALASRRGHVGGPVGDRSGFGGVPIGGANLTSRAGWIGGSGPADADLAISHWGESRPRVHTLFVSAFKDRTLGCPSCKETKLQFEGDRWSCAACNGSFVEDAALSAMVMEMTQQPWQPPALRGAAGDRPCPVCKAPMLVEVLEAVTVDRCAPHGVWFDAKELSTALLHAGSDHRENTSWIRQLFHRHGHS